MVASGGEGYVGAQAGDADLTIRVTDAATGEELDAQRRLRGARTPRRSSGPTEGQRLTVEVAGFDDEQAGGFVLYYER